MTFHVDELSSGPLVQRPFLLWRDRRQVAPHHRPEPCGKPDVCQPPRHGRPPCGIVLQLPASVVSTRSAITTSPGARSAVNAPPMPKLSRAWAPSRSSADAAARAPSGRAPEHSTRTSRRPPLRQAARLGRHPGHHAQAVRRGGHIPYLTARSLLRLSVRKRARAHRGK